MRMLSGSLNRCRVRLALPAAGGVGTNLRVVPVDKTANNLQVRARPVNRSRQSLCEGDDGLPAKFLLGFARAAEALARLIPCAPRQQLNARLIAGQRDDLCGQVANRRFYATGDVVCVAG